MSTCLACTVRLLLRVPLALIPGPAKVIWICSRPQGSSILTCLQELGLDQDKLRSRKPTVATAHLQAWTIPQPGPLASQQWAPCYPEGLLQTLCVCAHSLSCVQLFTTPWTIAHQVNLGHGIFQARILEWVAVTYSGRYSRPRHWSWVSCVSCIGKWVLHHCGTWEAHRHSSGIKMGSVLEIFLSLDAFIYLGLVPFLPQVCANVTRHNTGDPVKLEF